MEPLTWTPATTPPTLLGWYAAKLHASDRPVVLWWNPARPEWRNGTQRVQVEAWLGLL